MEPAPADESGAGRKLRLWPGVLLLVSQWLGWFVVPRALPSVPEAKLYGMLGGLAAGPAIALWWLFFSRAPWSERLGAVVLTIAAMAATRPFLHESVAQGNMGFQFYLHVIPVLSLAFVAWAVATRRLPDRLRRATMVAAILLACGFFTLLRSKGLTGEGSPEFAWRWAPTAEERLLARSDDTPPALPAAPKATAPAQAPEAAPAVIPVDPLTSHGPEETPAPAAPPPPTVEAPVEWPGFRGPDRNGVVLGVRLETDWSKAPPVELWRRPVGPAVSSFAVHRGRLYTQEQRGEDEVVACYDAANGEPLWMHRDTVRHWDSHVGAGPRATPALFGGRVYALGATGILNALDADSGQVAWSRNAASDAGAKEPTWGFVSSPLVVGDLVVVHAGALVAYDRATGERRWIGPAGGSYSSPQLLTIDGVPQLVLVSSAGARGVAPADGGVLWEHAWPGIGIVQPALTAEGDVLISQVDDMAVPVGTRRLSLAHANGEWRVEERWTSNRLKPSFSPFVVHEGHAYGFDGGLVACIDLANGARAWKGGRYGSGQLVLLPDQDLLLVVSEEGELALVEAAPGSFKELARFPALTGKTWSQPALVGHLLLVRNGEEMAAFRLAAAGG